MALQSRFTVFHLWVSLCWWGHPQKCLQYTFLSGSKQPAHSSSPAQVCPKDAGALGSLNYTPGISKRAAKNKQGWARFIDRFKSSQTYSYTNVLCNQPLSNPSSTLQLMPIHTAIPGFLIPDSLLWTSCSSPNMTNKACQHLPPIHIKAQVFKTLCFLSWATEKQSSGFYWTSCSQTAPGAGLEHTHPCLFVKGWFFWLPQGAKNTFMSRNNMQNVSVLSCCSFAFSTYPPLWTCQEEAVSTVRSKRV